MEKYERDPVEEAVLRGDRIINLGQNYLQSRTGKVRHIRHIILAQPLRNYFIKKVKIPLERAIVLLDAPNISWWKRILLIIEIIHFAKKYPSPTRGNVKDHNALILLDVRDWFLEHYGKQGKHAMLRAGITLLVVEYAHDPDYRWMFHLLLEELARRDWHERPPDAFPQFWEE